ncbi:MAG: hypothetical protein ABH858_01340 [Candidatus Omnitrophota bacterium]
MKITFLSGIITFFIFAGTIDLCYCDVSLKIIVLNPSASEEKVVPVRYKLPLRIAKEDVLDSGGLKVDYDSEKGLYYVYGDVKLGPKESKTIKIVVRDIWKVPEEEVDSLFKILDDNIAAIKDYEKWEAAKIVGENIKAKIESISRLQADISSDIEKRMQMYSVILGKIKDVKNDIFSLENLVEFGEMDVKYDKTITFAVEAQNILDKEVKVPLRYYLPKEVTPEEVIDKGRFDIKYDYQKEQFYLTAEESFKPKELKQFSIKLKNIWYFPEEIIERYGVEADKLNDKISETDFAAIGEILINEINRHKEAILSSQAKALSVEESIHVYSINKDRVAAIKDSLDKLRQLLVKKDESKAQAQPKEEAFERRNVIKDVKFLQQLTELSKNFFQLKGRTVWQIIFLLVIFVIGLTTFFYGVWFINLQKEEKRKLRKIGFK